MSVKFEKLKLPSYGQMGGVAFHASDVQLSGNGPRVLLFGGQRQGISGAMYSFEQSTGDGYLLLPEGAEGADPPPAPRTQASLTSIGSEPQSQLILFGGYALNIGCVNDLWRCTIGLDASSMPVPTWEKLEPSGTTPDARYGHSATFVPTKGRIVYFGGQDPIRQFGDVHILDPDPNNLAWSQPSVSGSAPMARMKHSATCVGGSQVFVFGGFNKKERVLADFNMLDLSADCSSVSWMSIHSEPPPGSKAISARAQHSACTSQDSRYVFIFGGYDGFKSMNDLWVVDLQASTTRNIAVEAPVPEARARHTAHMVGDLLHLFGGYDGSKPIGGDVYTLDCSDPASMEGAGGDDKKKKDDKDGGKGGEEEED
uniref:Uncharacterized protein n=1 Tax=Haptolina brevifila TaxID=156173 RepID=A0A7S2IDL6_9EUKA|mmetsp:Transcript_65018/g.128556  ORF Transcript_65018/g.128556 Transcript_65018/m.128556 type:complete len:370 (+) Transcript_65018:119-1228(+)